MSVELTQQITAETSNTVTIDELLRRVSLESPGLVANEQFANMFANTKNSLKESCTESVSVPIETVTIQELCDATHEPIDGCLSTTTQEIIDDNIYKQQYRKFRSDCRSKMSLEAFSPELSTDLYNNTLYYCVKKIEELGIDPSVVLSLNHYYQVIDFMIQNNLYLNFIKNLLTSHERIRGCVVQHYMLSKMRVDPILTKLTLNDFPSTPEWICATCKRILIILRENIRSVKYDSHCPDDATDLTNWFGFDHWFTFDFTLDQCFKLFTNIECIPLLSMYFNSLSGDEYSSFKTLFETRLDEPIVTTHLPEFMKQLGNHCCDFMTHITSLRSLFALQLVCNNESLGLIRSSEHHYF
jgi:hypothetical protein